MLFNTSNAYTSTINTFKLLKIDRLIEKKIKDKKDIIKKKENLINKLLEQHKNNFILLLNWVKLDYDIIIKEKDKIIINLDVLFEKTISNSKYNYDLSKFKINLQFLDMLLWITEKWYDYCWNKIKINQITFLYLIIKKQPVKLSYEENFRILACYLQKNRDKYEFTYEIKTSSASYRRYNINKWLSLFNNYIWKKWEVLDIWQILLDADRKTKNNLYREWFVIINWEEKKAYAWGLCGITTLFYQALLRVKDINILQRQPHSIFYKYLYQNYWEDATMYWSRWKAVVTLKVKNNQQDFLIKPFTYLKKWFFYTWLKLIWLQPISKEEVKFIKRIWNCVYTKRWNQTIKSCYKKFN